MINYLLQHLLDETASKFPDNIALKSENESITYKDLLTQSNRLANMLIHIGLKPGNVVGIYLNKSIEAIIAMFAILKAGGVYIPLDAHYSPLSRIKNIIKLSQTRFLLSKVDQWECIESHSLEDEISIFQNIKAIFVDNVIPTEKPNLINNKEKENRFMFDGSISSQLKKDTGGTDDDLAYILYTSGSTGIPKGVMLTHRNALTFINWALSYFRPSNKDIFSNVAPLHFDLSVFDIYVCIASGGCLNLVPLQINNNPRAMVQWISERKITYFYSVPSLWVSILNYAGLKPGDLTELKNILFAGEVFPPKYLKMLMGLLPNASFYNLYGPTETNVCTFYHVKSPDEINGRPVPIGKACANTELVVLNEKDEPLTIGEEGELLVKGSIVTKGYYKDIEKTKQAFKKSPLSWHHGALLYKTGDIVKRIGEDLYEYVGRKDLMVKCSGFRIELQEVEHALYLNDAIEEAVVVPIFNEKRESISIRAFVKIKKGQHFSVIELKEFLGGILPKYMIPETIQRLEQIPKNSNGKIDRQKVKEWIAPKSLKME